MHLGRRRHGADDIARGHRVNLIMWNWNRAYRQSAAYTRRAYSKEAQAPDRVCVSFTHDRDYEAVRGEARPAVAGKASAFERTSWCPPPFAEYEGFVGASGRYQQKKEVKAPAVDPEFPIA